MQLINILPVQNTLGEGVIWDHQRQRFWWTDIEASRLYRYDPDTQELESWVTPERLACLAPIAARDDLVVAFESGFAYYQPESSTIEWIHKIESDNPGTRMNDGRTDRQGRFWAGSMVETQEQASYKGSLYSLDSHQLLHKHISGLNITNSLCWSPDGSVMYHCDTPSRCIQRYRFDTEHGSLENKEDWIQTEPGCFPDGSCVDREGYLWNAQWGGSKLVRYDPDGNVDLEVALPVSQPTCLAFGGENLNLLVVTTARQNLSSEELARQPEAGNVLIFETDYEGVLDAEYLVERN
jgi:sugar lactone lactonase YvrE